MDALATFRWSVVNAEKLHPSASSSPTKRELSQFVSSRAKVIMSQCSYQDHEMTFKIIVPSFDTLLKYSRPIPRSYNLIQNA